MSARLGSDEFALLLTDCSADAAAGIARRLAAGQEQPLTVGDQRFNVTVSVGVACPGTPGRSLEGLMQQAATAMNVARQNGRGGWQMYAETMNAGMRDRWQLEHELRTALERRQFVLHYQPQVDLRNNRIIGVDALVRWQNPRLGLVAPDHFIALAEEAGLAPEWLTLEMTESTLMEGSSDTIGILSELRNQGISLAIDDFGTGYSSLSYLKRFPLDRLKVDQSFVRDIDCDPDDLAIAGAIINLGHTLRLTVIAEGVETAAQLDLLRQHRCDQAQGFHFARALPAADMEVLLGHPALRQTIVARQ